MCVINNCKPIKKNKNIYILLSLHLQKIHTDMKSPWRASSWQCGVMNRHQASAAWRTIIKQTHGAHGAIWWLKWCRCKSAVWWPTLEKVISWQNGENWNQFWIVLEFQWYKHTDVTWLRRCACHKGFLSLIFCLMRELCTQRQQLTFIIAGPWCRGGKIWYYSWLKQKYMCVFVCVRSYPLCFCQVFAVTFTFFFPSQSLLIYGDLNELPSRNNTHKQGNK